MDKYNFRFIFILYVERLSYRSSSTISPSMLDKFKFVWLKCTELSPNAMYVLRNEIWLRRKSYTNTQYWSVRRAKLWNICDSAWFSRIVSIDFIYVILLVSLCPSSLSLFSSFVLCHPVMICCGCVVHWSAFHFDLSDLL